MQIMHRQIGNNKKQLPTINIRKPRDCRYLILCTFTKNCNGLISWWHRKPGQRILEPIGTNGLETV